MKKRILALLMAAMMCAGALTACSDRQNDTTTENNNTQTEAPAKKDVALDEIVTAVKEAYGEKYLPSMELPAEYLSDVMGINMDDVEASFAEGPMMSAHIDTFVVLKAKEGKADALAAQLSAYLEQQQNDAMCYPNNLIRIQYGQVMNIGGYAIYMVLGAYDDNATDEAAQAKYAEEQSKVGADAVIALFA